MQRIKNIDKNVQIILCTNIKKKSGMIDVVFDQFMQLIII